MSHKNLITLDFAGKPYKEVQLMILKLKFFHTWIFFYFYCADSKFIKNILKSKFDFVSQLFMEELNTIFKSESCVSLIKRIYSPKLEHQPRKTFCRKYKLQQSHQGKGLQTIR